MKPAEPLQSSGPACGSRIRSQQGKNMWYFAWILGVSLAVLLAVVNAMVYEVRQDNLRRTDER